eukprot:7036788-Pyramimonas_sp.AAC.1
MRNNRTARPRDESSPQGGSPRRIVAPGRLTLASKTQGLLTCTHTRSHSRSSSAPKGPSEWPPL